MIKWDGGIAIKLTSFIAMIVTIEVMVADIVVIIITRRRWWYSVTFTIVFSLQFFCIFIDISEVFQSDTSFSDAFEEVGVEVDDAIFYGGSLMIVVMMVPKTIAGGIHSGVYCVDGRYR